MNKYNFSFYSLNEEVPLDGEMIFYFKIIPAAWETYEIKFKFGKFQLLWHDENGNFSEKPLNKNWKKVYLIDDEPVDNNEIYWIKKEEFYNQLEPARTSYLN